MNLVGYTATALSRNDIEDTPKDKNVVSGAIVELKTLQGDLVTIYDDASGTNPETQKACDSDGQCEFYAEAGDYNLEVNGKVNKISLFFNKDKVNDIAAWGDRFVGYFADGFTYTKADDVAKGADGKYYSYSGASVLPVVVSAGTVPSVPEYTAVVFNQLPFTTPELFGADYTDDTLALDAAFNSGLPVFLSNKKYVYKKATHGAGIQNLAKVIYGAGWEIACDGEVTFGLMNNSSHVGGLFTSNNVFEINPATPRSSANDGVMLLTNVEPITAYKLHCDFSYNAALDGSTRGEGFVRVSSFDSCHFDIKSNQNGCVLGTWINCEGGKIQGTLNFTNFETGLLKRSGMSEYLDINATNTPLQLTNFRNTSDTVPSKNGKDAILSEASTVKTPETNLRLVTNYNIERGAYLQRAGKGRIDAVSIGSDCGKCTDDSEGLTIYANAKLMPDGSTEQRYSWQIYGGVNGAVKDIDLYPTCHNLTGASGNKEAFSILGECENITVHQPYGYECGNGLWLVQNIGGIFSPRIDGITILGGRAEGANGVTPPNGAIVAWFNSKDPSQYIKNLVIDGTASMPSSTGNTTFLIRDIESSAVINNVKVDGANTAASYERHVFVDNCEGLTQTSSELQAESDGYKYVYPLAILRTMLGSSTTKNTVIGNIATPPNPATISIEIRASHNSQPAGNYIRYKGDLLLGASASQSVDLVDASNANQSISLSYNASNGDITLTHTSSSALGFDDATFYGILRSTKEVSFS